VILGSGYPRSSHDHHHHGCTRSVTPLGKLIYSLNVSVDGFVEFEGDLDIGGPNLAGQFVRRGLVDEYRLLVHPVVLGAGTPFWPEIIAPLPLRLIETRTFTSGAELRSYVPS
jgi:RibD domain-containing protein